MLFRHWQAYGYTERCSVGPVPEKGVVGTWGLRGAQATTIIVFGSSSGGRLASLGAICKGATLKINLPVEDLCLLELFLKAQR